MRWISMRKSFCGLQVLLWLQDLGSASPLARILCMKSQVRKRTGNATKTAHVEERMQFVGEGFLFRMVRHLVGALVAVGAGRIDAAHLERWLREGVAAGGRGGSRGWSTAEARGLHKIRVLYPTWQAVDENMHAEGHAAAADTASE